MNLIPRQARLTSSTRGVPGGAVRCRARATDDADSYPSIEMTAPVPVSLAPENTLLSMRAGTGRGGWPGR